MIFIYNKLTSFIGVYCFCVKPPTDFFWESGWFRAPPVRTSLPRIDGTSRGGVGFAVGKSMDGREARGLTIWHLAFQNTMYCAQLFSADRSLIVFACGDANKKKYYLREKYKNKLPCWYLFGLFRHIIFPLTSRRNVNHIGIYELNYFSNSDSFDKTTETHRPHVFVQALSGNAIRGKKIQ